MGFENPEEILCNLDGFHKFEERKKNLKKAVTYSSELEDVSRWDQVINSKKLKSVITAELEIIKELQVLKIL